MLYLFFNRGDPTLVKTNVAITTGYLISGKRNTHKWCLWKWGQKNTHVILMLRWLIWFRALWPSYLCFNCFDCGNNVLSLFPLYFCFPDLLLIFYYWKAIGDKFFVIHHLAALYAYYYVLVSALLSNSRTCRQDGKETTKGEQLCPVKLSFFNKRKCPWPSPRSHAAPIYCRRGKYAQGKVSKHSREGNLMGV